MAFSNSAVPVISCALTEMLKKLKRIKYAERRVIHLEFMTSKVTEIYKESKPEVYNSSYYNIPDLVTSTILCFYYNVFGFVKWGKDIKISGEGNNIATKIGSAGLHSAYMDDWIDSMNDKVINCKLKLNRPKNESYWSYTILFGITSNDTEIDNVFFNDSTAYC